MESPMKVLEPKKTYSWAKKDPIFGPNKFFVEIYIIIVDLPWMSNFIFGCVNLWMVSPSENNEKRCLFRFYFKRLVVVAIFILYILNWETGVT